MVSRNKITVRITANFETNLGLIENFWNERGFPQGFDLMLEELGEAVIPHLERFPNIGKPILKAQAQSIEALSRMEKIESRLTKLDSNAELREYVMEEYLVLYAVMKSAVYLLAIKHQKQLAFDYS